MTQLDWQRAFAARPDLTVLAFSWHSAFQLPWVSFRDVVGYRWSWTQPDHFLNGGWMWNAVVQMVAGARPARQEFLVAVHTRPIASARVCAFVDRRAPAAVIDEVVRRGCAYLACRLGAPT